MRLDLAFAVSRKDSTVLTIIWAKWLLALGDLECRTIHIGFTAEVLPAFEQELVGLFFGHDVKVSRYAGRDPGYPDGSNRLFCMVMRGLTRPALWMESDMIPTRIGWLGEIDREYEQCGRPFLGPILKVFDSPHMNGTAVYPENWDELSEGTITNCPGYQPWDTNSRKKVIPLAVKSELLHHSYGNLSFPRHKGMLDDAMAAIHPCKDGSVLQEFNRRLSLLPPEEFIPDPEYFKISGFSHLNCPMKNAVRINFPGNQWAVAKCNTLSEIALANRTEGVQRIEEADYMKLISQKKIL